MQRQLLQIADRIPDDMLLTLLKCFAQLLTREPEQSSKSTGPFIRAFTKIRDDGADKQFSAILEEDEEAHMRAENETAGLDGDGDNECTFNYKIGNVVTQEVIYSMNNNDDDDIYDGQRNGEVPPSVINQNISDDDENREINNNLIDNEIYHNIYIAIDDENHQIGGESIDEGIEVEMPELLDPNEEREISGDEVTTEEFSNDVTDDTITNGHAEDTTENENDIIDESLAAQPQIDEQEIINEEEDEEEEEEKEPVVVEPIQKVTLDDIQREIHEMQMFLMNKGVVPENKSQHNQKNINHEAIMKKSKAKIEDAYKVDVCINLKKKGGEKRHSKSKAILSNYLNENDKYTRGDQERSHIFDPNVPNTPEDFLKEKSVLEKINKKKQKIKHLDVSWQKLCDSQKKVYK